MMVIVGCIVVIGCVLGGFTMAGGHIHALIHPSEVLTIGGASLGALIIMSPNKVLKDLIKGVLGTLKGAVYGPPAFRELFKLLYDLMRTARRDGLLMLESDLEEPEKSRLFSKYPLVLHNHHAIEFLCSGFRPLVEGATTPEQMAELLETELKVLEEEHHAAVAALTKTADGLPGFGIVAAVLGIVITMGAIDGPIEEIGHKVGAALVGTFLGILASYGFFNPLAGRMECLGHTEIAFFRVITSVVLATANGDAPKIAIERACRGAPSEVRPGRKELDELFKEVESSG
jgi:chemotaxis protein MotA